MSEGKWQPHVPLQRASVQHAGQPRSAHTNAYTSTSPFLVAGARVRYRVDEWWSAAVGVDNLTNRTCWIACGPLCDWREAQSLRLSAELGLE